MIDPRNPNVKLVPRTTTEEIPALMELLIHLNQVALATGYIISTLVPAIIEHLQELNNEVNTQQRLAIKLEFKKYLTNELNEEVCEIIMDFISEHLQIFLNK